MILGDNCHIYNYEGGGISALGGLAFHVLHNEPNGQLPLDQLQAAVRPDDAHCSRSGLICLESSHNRCGGTVLSLEYMAAVKQWADGHGMPVHLDGARVFNAAQALGVDVGTIAAHVTSVQFCLSKVNISMNHISHQSTTIATSHNTIVIHGCLRQLVVYVLMTLVVTASLEFRNTPRQTTTECHCSEILHLADNFMNQ